MRLGFKFAMVLGLTLAILVPLMMIRGVIQERQGYRNEVVRDIASNVGGRQVIGGPVLVVPFEETERAEVAGDDGIVRTVVRRKQRQWTFFPETLLVDGEDVGIRLHHVGDEGNLLSQVVDRRGHE